MSRAFSSFVSAGILGKCTDFISLDCPSFFPRYFKAFLALIQGFGDTVHTMRTNEFLAYCSSPSLFMTWNEQGFSFGAWREGERGRDGRRTQATLTVSPHFPSPFSSSTAVERETSTEKGGRSGEEEEDQNIGRKGEWNRRPPEGIRQVWGEIKYNMGIFRFCDSSNEITISFGDSRTGYPAVRKGLGRTEKEKKRKKTGREEDKVGATARRRKPRRKSRFNFSLLFLFALSSVPNFSCPKIFYLRTTDRHNGENMG